MEKPINVFQVDSDIIKESLGHNNYLIEYSNQVTSEKYCIIYFSSNDIYYPNNEQAFKDQLLKKNRFEWYGTRINKGSKHIFIRDIQKQWYLKGINNTINTVDKLSAFLQIETEGYKIITIGSSAGGYAAVLFGQILNAEQIITINGQFNHQGLLQTSTEELNPIIFRERDNADVNKYFRLNEHISTPETIYYLFSGKSKWDIDQNMLVNDIALNRIEFSTSHHGIPFLKSSLSRVINMSTNNFGMLVNKVHNPLLFSIKVEGLFNFSINLVDQIIKRIIKKLKQFYKR